MLILTIQLSSLMTQNLSAPTHLSFTQHDQTTLYCHHHHLLVQAIQPSGTRGATSITLAPTCQGTETGIDQACAPGMAYGKDKGGGHKGGDWNNSSSGGHGLHDGCCCTLLFVGTRCWGEPRDAFSNSQLSRDGHMSIVSYMRPCMCELHLALGA